MTFGLTFFEQVHDLIATLSTIAANWGSFYTHPRKKQK